VQQTIQVVIPDSLAASRNTPADSVRLHPSTPPASKAPYQLHTPGKSPSHTVLSKDGNSLERTPGVPGSAPNSPVSSSKSIISKDGSSLEPTPEKIRASASRNTTFSPENLRGTDTVTPRQLVF